MANLNIVTWELSMMLISIVRKMLKLEKKNFFGKLFVSCWNDLRVVSKKEVPSKAHAFRISFTNVHIIILQRVPTQNSMNIGMMTYKCVRSILA